MMQKNDKKRFSIPNMVITVISCCFLIQKGLSNELFVISFLSLFLFSPPPFKLWVKAPARRKGA